MQTRRLRPSDALCSAAPLLYTAMSDLQDLAVQCLKTSALIPGLVAFSLGSRSTLRVSILTYHRHTAACTHQSALPSP